MTNYAYNPGFELGTQGWTLGNTLPSRDKIYLDDYASQSGEYGLYCEVWGDQAISEVSFKQTANLTGVSRIGCAFRWVDGDYINSLDFYIGLWIDGGFYAYASTKPGVWANFIKYFDTTPFQGNHSVEFRVVGNTTVDWCYGIYHLDNVEFYSDWAAPQAYFSASPTSGNAPLTVTFTNATYGIPTPTYLWSFGDGTTSTAASPSHVYQNSGIYNVTLRALNAMGDSTYTRTIYVYGLPYVEFRPVPEGGGRDTIVTFKNMSTAYPAVSAWSWWFEGGQYPDVPDSTLFEPTHRYTAPGRYTVRLRATNNVGTVTTTKVDCVTISDDLSVEKSVENVGILINGKLFPRF